jgi:iron complex transport system permease protein
MTDSGRRLLSPPLIVITVASVLLMVFAAISLTIGAVSIPLSSIAEILLGTGSAEQATTEAAILLHLRLPRILTACLVGGLLGAAGVAYQGLYRNPLADPYIIGASSGAG